MSTSQPPREPVICNTTPVRHFAVVGRFDLLVEILGGTVYLPRQVLDPDDLDSLAPLLSELGRTERYFATRGGDIESWSRLHALRQRDDIEVVDLDADELAVFAELQSRSFLRPLGLTALGTGEAAVISVAAVRGWGVVMDDAAARTALSHKSPGTQVTTSRELLRGAAVRDHVTSEQADDIYLEMRSHGYRGPDSLWTP